MKSKTVFKTIEDFLYLPNKVFVIPDYQRGYKWAVIVNEKAPSAVEKLLDSLISANKVQPYFLQGVTVVEDDNKVIFIDGQQRTTTLYLLLWCLNKELINNIQLEYEVREKSKEFINNLKADDFDPKSFDKENSNQDIYYFKEAINQINKRIDNIKKSEAETDAFIKFLKEKVTILYIIIDTWTNTWHDFGINCGGDSINLIQILHNTDIKNALKILGSGEFNVCQANASSPEKLNMDRYGKIRIQTVGAIINSELLRYLNHRGIPIYIASEYCKEVHYTCNSKNYIAIGFKNDNDGYELRSPNFKGKSKDGISTIHVTSSNQLNLFEGFFDFLSALTFFKSLKPNHTTIVLNSTNKLTFGKVEKLNQLFTRYSRLNVFFDNDPVSMTGQKAVEELQRRHNNVNDQSKIYQGYKDFNEYLMRARTQ